MIKIQIILSIAAIVSVIVFVWGWFTAEIVVKIPRLPVETTPDMYGVQYEKIEFDSIDGIPLKAWFIRYPGSHTTIIVLHGWGANKGTVFTSTYFLNTRGHYNLLYFDYRNHGESGGSRSSLGCLEKRDLSSAIDFLKQKKSKESEIIGVLGVSLGGAIGVLVTAERKEIQALVIESAFTTPLTVISRYAKLFYGIPRYPLISILMFFAQLRLKVWFKNYQAVDYIPKISPRPVFIIQGSADVRMPFSEGEMLYNAAQEPKQIWTVKGADHGEAYTKASVEYEKKVMYFFNRYLNK